MLPWVVKVVACLWVGVFMAGSGRAEAYRASLTLKTQAPILHKPEMGCKCQA